MGHNVDRWVRDRAAAAELDLSPDDLASVCDVARGLVPFLDSWSSEVQNTAPPFVCGGRPGERRPAAGPVTPVRVGDRVEADDPFRTLISPASAEVLRRGDSRLATRFTVKSNIDVAGVDTNCGASPELAAMLPWTPTRSSPVVQSMIDAGAELVGLANLGELALDATSDNPWHGRVDNPAATGRTPGGSSGGSAAGIAAGLADVALGTDSAGSVRIPAAFCEIVGYRPTPGRVSLEGLRGAAWTIDTIGFMADSLRTIREATEAVGVARWQHVDRPPRVGFLAHQELGAVQPAVEQSYRAAIDAIDSDAECHPIDLSAVLDAPAVAAVIAYAEVARHLAGAVRAAPNAFGRPARQLVQFGALLSAGDYLLAQQMRTMLGERWSAATSDLDAVLTPTVPMAATARSESPPAATRSNQASAQPSTSTPAPGTTPPSPEPPNPCNHGPRRGNTLEPRTHLPGATQTDPPKSGQSAVVSLGGSDELAVGRRRCEIHAGKSARTAAKCKKSGRKAAGVRDVPPKLDKQGSRLRSPHPNT